jgi:hypothetical protein
MLFRLPLLLLPLVIVLNASCSKQANPKEKLPETPIWTIRTEILMVALPEPAFLEILPSLQSSATIEAATTKLLESVKRGEAILTGYPVAHTLPNQRVAVETIVERRYPVEFEPPQVSSCFPTTPTTPSSFEPTPGTTVTTTVTTTQSPTKANQNAFPTSFETRNTGITLEVEPTVNESGTLIDLQLVPQRVEFLQYDTFSGRPEPGSFAPTVDQPRFSTGKVTHRLVVKSGERILIGVHPLTKPEKHVEVFILQATANRIGK